MFRRDFEHGAIEFGNFDFDRCVRFALEDIVESDCFYDISGTDF